MPTGALTRAHHVRSLGSLAHPHWPPLYLGGFKPRAVAAWELQACLSQSQASGLWQNQQQNPQPRPAAQGITPQHAVWVLQMTGVWQAAGGASMPCPYSSRDRECLCSGTLGIPGGPTQLLCYPVTPAPPRQGGILRLSLASPRRLYPDKLLSPGTPFKFAAKLRHPSHHC